MANQLRDLASLPKQLQDLLTRHHQTHPITVSAERVAEAVLILRESKTIAHKGLLKQQAPVLLQGHDRVHQTVKRWGHQPPLEQPFLTESGEPSYGKETLTYWYGRLSVYQGKAVNLGYFSAIKARLGQIQQLRGHAALVNGVYHVIPSRNIAVTGRVTMTGPNVQGFSLKDKNHDEQHPVYPWWGEVLKPCTFDIKQADMYAIANVSRDDGYLADLASGDYHQRMADVWGVDRPTAKQMGLALMYSSSAERFAHVIGVSLEEARELIDIRARRYPTLMAWEKVVTAEAAATGRVYVPGDSTPIPVSKSTQPVAYICQGLVARSMAAAILDTYETIKESFLYDVHDSFIMRDTQHFDLLKEAVARPVVPELSALPLVLENESAKQTKGQTRNG